MNIRYFQQFSKKLLNFQIRYNKSEIYYTFDKSVCQFAVWFRDFNKISVNCIEDYKKIGINKFLYDILDPQESYSFLAEKRNDTLKYLLDQKSLIGCISDLPYTAMPDQFMRIKEVQAFLQSVSLFFKLQVACSNNEKFQVYTGISNPNQSIAQRDDYKKLNREQKANNLFNNFENIKSVVKNTFGFDLIFLSQHENNIGKLWQREEFIKKFKSESMAFDLNLIQDVGNKQEKDKITKEFMMHIYEYSSNLKAIYMHDFKEGVQNKFINCNLGEGLVSFSHLIDIFKLCQFQGYIIFEKEDIEPQKKNIQFVENILKTQGFIRRDIMDMQSNQASHQNKDNAGTYI